MYVPHRTRFIDNACEAPMADRAQWVRVPVSWFQSNSLVMVTSVAVLAREVKGRDALALLPMLVVLRQRRGTQSAASANSIISWTVVRPLNSLASSRYAARIRAGSPSA